MRRLYFSEMLIRHALALIFIVIGTCLLLEPVRHCPNQKSIIQEHQEIVSSTCSFVMAVPDQPKAYTDIVKQYSTEYPNPLNNYFTCRDFSNSIFDPPDYS